MMLVSTVLFNAMHKNEIENIEIDLLLDAIFKRYGFDFRNYAKASIKRRIHHATKRLHCKNIMELTYKTLHDTSFFQELVKNLSVTVTEMFRDPMVYKTIRTEIIPYLATFPFIKIWHAGCATGEEVYSLAIILKEEGLYERCTIYATDFNDIALNIAKEGIYPIPSIKNWINNYNKSGGHLSFSEYFQTDSESACLAKSLKKNITFASHNLATDEVFGEMHLVLCRNVLIYFDKTLQNRALKLFTESLVRDGFLCIGTKESLRFTEVESSYDKFNTEMNIFRRRLS